ncbi:hypothetical protein KIW84_030524 [Lathyrus oleraceus]|uniref:Uncharacterized protein n=1 Tax=Pisum sativum TaxID=3888 RepID=A0A9D4XPZ3_PEA|nr:hypothetical protein KIW84_030524 [Pisum sativum]
MIFSMTNYFASIEILNGSNFKKWMKDLEFLLGIIDLDMALCETKLVINAQRAPEEKEKLAKMKRSNLLSLCANKRTISEHLINRFPENENAKEYLTSIGERSSTAHGGFAPNENVVEPLVDNVIDPPIVTGVAQPTRTVKQIHVRIPINYLEATTCSQSSMWADAMYDELKSMSQ